jgi:hypothetical protein
MRAGARIPPLSSTSVERSTEDTRWLVELLSDATVRVTIDRGVNGGVLVHRGAPAAVRTRLATDAESRDRAAVDDAVRDITGAQAAPETGRVR